MLWYRYIEVQSGSSFHMKATMVQQSARSSYTCNEATVGACISRHDLSIKQVQCYSQHARSKTQAKTYTWHVLDQGSNQPQPLLKSASCKEAWKETITPSHHHSLCNLASDAATTGLTTKSPRSVAVQACKSVMQICHSSCLAPPLEPQHAALVPCHAHWKISPKATTSS